MARKYTISVTTEVADFAAAIADFYGEGNYTIYYQNSEFLVFKIPAISNKVLRVKFMSGAGGHFNYGDEWTSGSDITNVQYISLYFNSAVQGSADLILSQYSLQFFNTDTSFLSTIIIGQLSNGEYAGIGLQNTTSQLDRSVSKLMTDDSIIIPMFPSIVTNNVSSESNKLLKFRMYIANTTPVIKSDLEGNPVYMKDVGICRHNSILDSDNIYIKYMNCYYNNYSAYGLSTVGFATEIDNYTL